jgi:hypothetical protein
VQYPHLLLSRNDSTDIARAKQLWEKTTWVNRDTIDTHSQRFLKRLSLLRDSVATRPDRSNDIPTNNQASMKYLSLLVTSLPKSHGLRNNNNSIIGGDDIPTHYENGGDGTTNYENGGDSPITNIDSRQTFNMKRNLPTDADDENDSITTADDYEEAITNLDSLRTFAMKRHLPTDTDDENDSITTADDHEHETPAAYTLDASPTDDNEPPPLLRRSIRRKTPTTRYTYRANVAIQQNISEIPDDLQIYMHRAYQADIVNSLDTTSIDPLLPTPDHWRHILTYPTTTKSLWTKSFAKEFNELIKKGTVAHDTPSKDDPIIPITVKYRVKLTSEGQVDKLKTRIALRGDMMKDEAFTHSTWCPIAGFSALKIFIAFAAECRQRGYQLDFVAAFLQAEVIGRKFIKFPSEWKELFSNYPDLHQWIGMPHRLKKSLYGDRVANLAWDETQSKWLTSPEIGFARLPSEESIYIKRVGNDLITILNAVDDQLYFAT